MYYAVYTSPTGMQESKESTTWDDALDFLNKRTNTLKGYKSACIFRVNDDNSEELVLSFREIK